jgi:hypothetical protein
MGRLATLAARRERSDRLATKGAQRPLLATINYSEALAERNWQLRRQPLVVVVLVRNHRHHQKR